MRIINLTQHPATAEQAAAGVFEPADKQKVQRLLTFNVQPVQDEIVCRAQDLAAIAAEEKAEAAMIGGALWLMGPLEVCLRHVGVIPLYAFSVREVVETANPDGSVSKTAVFRHRGFVEGIL